MPVKVPIETDASSDGCDTQKTSSADQGIERKNPGVFYQRFEGAAC